MNPEVLTFVYVIDSLTRGSPWWLTSSPSLNRHTARLCPTDLLLTGRVTTGATTITTMTWEWSQYFPYQSCRGIILSKSLKYKTWTALSLGKNIFCLATDKDMISLIYGEREVCEFLSPQFTVQQIDHYCTMKVSSFETRVNVGLLTNTTCYHQNASYRNWKKKECCRTTLDLQIRFNQKKLWILQKKRSKVSMKSEVRRCCCILYHLYSEEIRQDFA
jgi:hypothetical protein